MNGTLNAEQILELGVARSGCDLPESPTWRRGFELLIESASNEGNLNEAGVQAMGDKLVTLVDERLRGEALLRETDQCGTPSVRFVVAGLARSGTTLLHRLLSCDPGVTYLRTWQAFKPVPPGPDGPDRRRDSVVEMIEQLARVSPESMKLHPLHVDAPEEEVFLLQHSFASMLFGMNAALPSYSDWLNSTSHTDAYRFAFDLLRLNDLAAGLPRVMKSPQFLLDLGVVEALLPDAIIVQTHRDPVDLVGSYCSVYEHTRRQTTKSIDRTALGIERLDQLATMGNRSIAVRDAAVSTAPHRYVDVHYRDLVADPLSVVARLYAHAGVPFTAPARKAMQTWLSEHPQGRGDASHKYDLTDYGLDRGTIEERLATYLARFGVERD